MPVCSLVATTVTSYTVAGDKAAMEHAGVGQDTAVGVPPPRGDALNVNDFQGPPAGGGLARSSPLFGPTASADNIVAADDSGMVNGMSLPNGVSFPKADTPTTVATYLRS